MLEIALLAGMSGYLIYDFLLKDFIFSNEIRNGELEVEPERKTILKIEYVDGDKIRIEDDCGICMDKLNGIVLTTECKHEFHYKCFLDWINQKNTCPFCRNVIYIT